jgi:hypothetical protein
LFCDDPYKENLFRGESMIGWYHKEHHTFLILQDPLDFGKIKETHKERFLIKKFVEYIN